MRIWWISLSGGLMAGLPNGDAGIDDGTHVVLNNASQLAGRTQANVEADQRAQISGMSNPLSGALGFFFNTIMSGFATLGNFLEQIVHSITGAIGGTFENIASFMTNLVGNVGSALGGIADLLDDLWNNAGAVIGSIGQGIVSGLTGALAGLNSFVQSVVDGVMGGIRGIPIIGAGVSDLISALTGYRRKVVEVQKAADVNLQNFTISTMTGGYRNPSWVCRYPLADVSYPEVLNFRVSGSGTTEFNVVGTAHTHAYYLETETSGGYAAGARSFRGAFVTASSTTVFDTAAMILRRTTSGPAPNNVFIEVLRETPAGGLTGVATSADVAGLLSSTTARIEVDLVPPVIARAGERYVVRFRNSSNIPGSAAVTVTQISQSSILGALGLVVDTNDIHDDASYSSSQVASMSASAAGGVPWAMLATKNPPVQDQSFSDDFNRVNMGIFWHTVSNTGTDHVGITSSRAGFKGTTNGDQLGLYIQAAAGDQTLVEANTYSTVTTPRLGVMSCCNRDLTQCVYLGVNAGTAKVFTGAWGSLTERLSVPVTDDSGGDVDYVPKWGLYNDPSASKFFILKDGTDVGSWVDSGGVVLRGPDYRYGGIRISRASGVNAGTVDNWTFRDYAA